MDISCFIDYQILQIYIDNGDWPGNNIKFWKTNDLLSKWRWFLFDTDFGFNLFGNNGNTLTFATTTQGNSWPNPPWSTLFLRKLLANQEFKNSFVNRFSDCLNSNLLAEGLLLKTDSVQNLIMPEIEDHLTRWDFPYDRWLNEVERVRTFIKNRKNSMRNNIRSFFGFDMGHIITLALSDPQAGKIKINSIIPAEFPFKGYYFQEVPVSLSAIPNPGYRFVRWEGGSSSTNLNISVSLSLNTTYNAVFEPTSEEEQLVVINEINYKSPDDVDAGDWIELYNNGSQTVDLSGWVIHDADPESGFYFPKGLLLYPNEYLVVAGNLSKFGSLFPTVKNVTGTFPFGLSSSGDVIYLYNNEGNLIDNVNFGVQSPWPVDPCGLGPTLELEQPGLNNELAASWTAGQNGGTPGKQNSVFVNSTIISNFNLKATCFPTAFTDYTTLQFYSYKGCTYSIQLIDMQGKVHEQIEGNTNSEGTTTLDLFANGEHYKAEIYLVRFKTDENVQTVKVIKR
jgi:hypothetical protein